MRNTTLTTSLLLVLLALSVAGAPVTAQEGAEAQRTAAPVETAAATGEPAISVSPICAYQLSTAADTRAQALAAAADPDGDGRADAEVDVGAVMAALPPDWLDGAIRSCASLDDWLGANELFPDALGDRDAVEYVQDRCEDPAASLDGFATCRSVVAALATPAPVVEPAPTPGAVGPRAEPSPGPGTDAGSDQGAGTQERSGPRARVSKRFRAVIPGASEVRYFRIRGDTPFRLIAQNQVRSRPHCGSHEAIACVRMSWSVDIIKAYSEKTGRCTMKKVRTKLRSTVWLPRWVNRTGADAALVRWWRQVLEESAVHEAEHIRIQQKHLADFRREATGKSCGSAAFFFRKATAAANLAQAAFDEVEYQKPLPPIPLSLLD